MLCKKCKKLLEDKLFIQTFTTKNCNICQEDKQYGSWYNPWYCCSECSNKNHQCENCWVFIYLDFLESLLEIYKLDHKPDFINEKKVKWWYLKEFNSYIIKRWLKWKYWVFLTIEWEEPLFTIINNKQTLIYSNSNKEHIWAYLDMLLKV